jgi:CheY-like chemotaxis protein
VAGAGDGHQALALAQERQPDLVIRDVTLKLGAYRASLKPILPHNHFHNH